MSAGSRSAGLSSEASPGCGTWRHRAGAAQHRVDLGQSLAAQQALGRGASVLRGEPARRSRAPRRRPAQKLTWPPSVSTACQPCSCAPTISATPRPVPGPSTLIGPRSGGAGSPCRVTRCSRCSAGIAHATAPKSLSMRSCVEAQRALQFAAAERPRAVGQADLVVADRAGDRQGARARAARRRRPGSAPPRAARWRSPRSAATSIRSNSSVRRRQVGQREARIGAADVADQRERPVAHGVPSSSSEEQRAGALFGGADLLAHHREQFAAEAERGCPPAIGRIASRAAHVVGIHQRLHRAGVAIDADDVALAQLRERRRRRRLPG